MRHQAQPVFDRPVPTSARAFLRLLADADGGFVMAHGVRQKLAGSALWQGGYARREGTLPNSYAITPRGEHYLNRILRAD